MATINQATQQALITYIECLFEQGFTAVHVSDVIPKKLEADQHLPYYQRWTQFPQFSTHMVPYTMHYDQQSGWFRKKNSLDALI